jgi:hypothetical protein
MSTCIDTGVDLLFDLCTSLDHLATSNRKSQNVRGAYNVYRGGAWGQAVQSLKRMSYRTKQGGGSTWVRVWTALYSPLRYASSPSKSVSMSDLWLK